MNTKTSTKHTETVIAAGHHYACEFRTQRRGGYLVTSPQFLTKRISDPHEQTSE